WEFIFTMKNEIRVTLIASFATMIAFALAGSYTLSSMTSSSRFRSHRPLAVGFEAIGKGLMKE
ncbi:hypothetical protein ACLOJK_037262, partial [Asimina triloba]